MVRTGPTTLTLKNLIRDLRILSSKEKIRIWNRIADDLEKSTRQRREVNIRSINKNTKTNDIVIVPGKVLSIGELDHKVTVAAYRFSEAARIKINKKGNAITIQELIKENPKGKGVR